MQHKFDHLKIRTLFFGSGSFAVVILKILLSAGYIDLKGVVTQPDRAIGRKQEVTAAPVKKCLQMTNFKDRLYQPENTAEAAETILQEIKPELIIVADYGQILPTIIINFPKYKCLNIH